MKNVLTIRPAEVKDAKGIAHVHVTAWQETYRGLMPDSVLDTLSVESLARQWKETLEDTSNPYHPILVSEAKRKIIGFANFGQEREGDLEYKSELFAIYILNGYQGQGIGRRLVQKAAEGLQALKLTSMLVWVLSDNPYQKFYERLGGVYLREKSIPIGDTLLMEKAYGWLDIRPLAEMEGLS